MPDALGAWLIHIKAAAWGCGKALLDSNTGANPMLRLALILHIFIGSTLAGVCVIAALVAGMSTGLGLFVAALVGFLLAFPASWKVAQALYAR